MQGSIKLKKCQTAEVEQTEQFKIKTFAFFFLMSSAAQILLTGSTIPGLGHHYHL